MTEQQKKSLLRSAAALVIGVVALMVWPQFLALAVIGSALFAVSLARFRKALETMS